MYSLLKIKHSVFLLHFCCLLIYSCDMFGRAGFTKSYFYVVRAFWTLPVDELVSLLRAILC